MFKNARSLLMITGALAVGVFPVSAHARAQMGPGLRPQGVGDLGPLKMLLRTANLTADQQAQVHELLQSHRTLVQPLEAQIRTLHEQMADKLLTVGTVNAADFVSWQSQVAQLRTQIADQALKTALKIRALLSNDQIQHMNQVSQRMRSLHKEMETLVNPEGTEPPPPGGP
jgi:hypothetical protein